MPISTSASILRYRTIPGSGSWIDISDAVSGLSSFSLNNGAEPREIVSLSNQTAAQITGRTNWTGSFEVDVNATTRDEFMRIGSKRTEFEFTPSATDKTTGAPSSGDVRYTFEAITSANITFAADGVKTMTVDLQVDGEVTRATS